MVTSFISFFASPPPPPPITKTCDAVLCQHCFLSGACGDTYPLASHNHNRAASFFCLPRGCLHDVELVVSRAPGHSIHHGEGESKPHLHPQRIPTQLSRLHMNTISDSEIQLSGNFANGHEGEACTPWFEPRTHTPDHGHLRTGGESGSCPTCISAQSPSPSL